MQLPDQMWIPVWSESEWRVYLLNLAALRRHHFLTKAEFSHRVRIRNPLRKGTQRPSRMAILSICQAFDVTPEWLLTDHAADSAIDSASESNLRRPAADQAGYPPPETTAPATGAPTFKIQPKPKRCWIRQTQDVAVFSTGRVSGGNGTVRVGFASIASVSHPDLWKGVGDPLALGRVNVTDESDFVLAKQIADGCLVHEGLF
jgi:hypothetical protein